jgi:hypothetical protein
MFDPCRRVPRLALLCLFPALSSPLTARADRTGMQVDPAYMFEKAGNFPEAALYYHRALRGWKEFYIPFLWGEATNAPGKYTEYVQHLTEMADRLDKCLVQGNVDAAGRQRIEFLNDLWMDELLEQEGGEARTEVLKRAVESEKRGDFRLGEVLRACDARFARVVMMPYHGKCAAACEKDGRAAEAKLHREAVKTYERRAAEADLLSKGNKALMAIPGFGGLSPHVGIEIGRTMPLAIPGAYGGRVLTAKQEWKGRNPEEVAATLKEQGLKHADENARLSAVTVLANLGEKEAVADALGDASATVRLAATKALAAMRWADGWAACHRHADAAVRAQVAPLLAPAEKDVLVATWVVTELLRGLGSPSAQTQAFCQAALEGITGKKMKGAEWSAWWKGLGNPWPGLLPTDCAPWPGNMNAVLPISAPRL